MPQFAIPFVILLLLTGGTLLFAAWWQARWMRRLGALGRRLAVLRPSSPDQWPEQARPVLEQAGIALLSWTGEWFGQPLQGQWGTSGTPHHWSTILEEADGDIRIALAARWRHPRGEAAWLAATVCEWFALHWRALARQQAAGVNAALRQRAYVTLMLLHDLRNFAQWVLWAVEDLQDAATDAALLERARQLAAAAPELRIRAQALLERSRGHDSIILQEPPTDLALLVRNTAALHGLTLTLHGQATTRTPLAIWLTVLDNLFINCVQHRAAGQPQPSVDIEPRNGKDAGVRLTLSLPDAQLSVPVATMFAPLLSGRPDGSGVGLYLARRAARSSGGDLQVNASPLAFIVELP